MRRSVDQAFIDLRQHLEDWAHSGAKPGIRIFVYPPEWEARMLKRFPTFAAECSDVCQLQVADVGQGFLAEVERRKGFADQLKAVERERPERALHDLSILARRSLEKLLAAPLEPPSQARLMVNTGAIGVFTSFSAITNALHDAGPESGVGAPTVLAFPGEGDDRSLNPAAPAS